MSYGIAVMKLAPLHLQHCYILSRMVATTQRCAVFLPPNELFDFAIRAEMVKNVFGDRITVHEITNIGARETGVWANHVLKHAIAESGGDIPTDYFAGRREDAIWMQDFFFNKEFAKDFTLFHFRLSVDPTTGLGLPDRTAQDFYDLPVHARHRRLHMLEDSTLFGISGTAIRAYLHLRHNYWERMVPEVNIPLIRQHRKRI